MSKELVKFKIPMRRFFSEGAMLRRKEGLMNIIEEEFNISRDEIYKVRYSDELTIICRPGQFGRFIIRRNEIGLDNNVKELEAEIVNPKPNSVIDASGFYKHKRSFHE